MADSTREFLLNRLQKLNNQIMVLKSDLAYFERKKNLVLILLKECKED